MKIKTIEVRRLYTFGNYENISFGYTANLGENEQPRHVQDELIKIIELDYDQFKADRNAALEKQAVESRIKWDITARERELKDLCDQVERIRALLENIGVQSETIDHFLPSDDLPF